MKAIVDQETCTGCGLCVDVCPQVFQIETDKAATVVDMVPADALEDCQQAEEDCPVAAITVQE